MTRYRVKVEIDTDTDRFAVWKDGIGWVEFDMPEMERALTVQMEVARDAVASELRRSQAEPMNVERMANVLHARHRIPGSTATPMECCGGLARRDAREYNALADADFLTSLPF